VKRRDFKQRATAENDDGFLWKKSRDDWTPLELFLAGVPDWTAEIRRIFAPQLGGGRWKQQTLLGDDDACDDA
jgi:hypothetical protein